MKKRMQKRIGSEKHKAFQKRPMPGAKDAHPAKRGFDAVSLIASKGLFSQAGLSRAATIILVLVIVMIVVVSIPFWSRVRWQMDRIACLTSLDSATRQMAVDYLANNQNPTPEDVKEVVTYAMNGWDDLCPRYGTIYIVPVETKATDKEEHLPYRLVCGIHGDDKKEVTRLNAGNAKDQLDKQITDLRDTGKTIPETLTVHLNNEDLVVQRLAEPSSLRRGTSATIDEEEEIAAYFTVSDSSELSWFVYADKNHAAVWRINDGWTGDSYSGQ